jgi:hypothetical protein
MSGNIRRAVLGDKLSQLKTELYKKIAEENTGWSEQEAARDR